MSDLKIFVAICLVTLVAFAEARAPPQRPRAFFVFGDSLVDNGNNNYLLTTARADLPPYGIDSASHSPSGRFSNGLNIPDLISEKLGAPPTLPYLSSELNGGNLLTGANFASAGVGILNDTGFQFVNILRIGQQLYYFEEYQRKLINYIGINEARKLVSNALVLITLGGNDFVNNYFLGPVTPRRIQFNLQDYTTFLIAEYKKILQRLYELGSRRVLVTGTGPLGCVPGEMAFRSFNGDCASEPQQAAALYNPKLVEMIKELNAELKTDCFVAVNAMDMQNDFINNPTAFGFTTSRVACCGQGPYNGVGLCTRFSFLCPDREHYVFWDAYHPTERANRIIVETIYNGSDKYMHPMNLQTIMKMGLLYNKNPGESQTLETFIIISAKHFFLLFCKHKLVNSQFNLRRVLSLCFDLLKHIILYGEFDISVLYEPEIPTEIVDWLIPRLSAAALQNLQDALPVNRVNELEATSGSQRNCKRCLDEAVEKADLPCSEGSLGEIEISDSILVPMGYERSESDSKFDYSKLAYHCQHFGSYARCLTLQGELLQAETNHLLKNSKLEALELQRLWYGSREKVEGVCKLLSQNVTTLTSLRFNISDLPSEFVNEIFHSLLAKDLPTHRIQHVSVNSSRFLVDSIFVPAGLVSFLSSARYLCTVDFADNDLQQNHATTVFSALCDASSNIASLDLSQNNISGWLSHFKQKTSSHLHRNPGICTLKSLCVLELREFNLQKDDVHFLEYVLFHMPNLKRLSLNDNPLEDDGIMTLMPYVNWIAQRLTPFAELSLVECKLTYLGVNSLLQVLSSFKNPLNSLRIGSNRLGSKVGVQLGKFICTGIKELDFQDARISSSGFVEAQDQITEKLKLVSICIRFNSGNTGAAIFLSKLIVSAPELVKIDASYNFLPAAAVPLICSSLETAKGKLRYLDLEGNDSCSRPANIAVLNKYVVEGHLNVVWPVPRTRKRYESDDNNEWAEIDAESDDNSE